MADLSGGIPWREVTHSLEPELRLVCFYISETNHGLGSVQTSDYADV